MGRKGYLQFWCLCRDPSRGNDAGCQRLPDDQMLVQRYKGQNQEIQKAAKILWIMKRKCKKQPENREIV